MCPTTKGGDVMSEDKQSVDEPKRSRRNPIDRLIGTVVPNVVDAVDIDNLVERVDVNALLARVDVDDLVERIDLNALLDQVDVNELVSRLDLDALLARVDIDAITDRIDIDRIVERADIAGIVAKSTTGVTKRSLDLARRQLVGIDTLVTRLGARVMRRDPDTDPKCPSALTSPTLSIRADARNSSVSGHYAGPLSRLVSFVIDAVAVVFLFGLATGVASWTIDLLVRDSNWDGKLGSKLYALLLAIWTLTYYVVPLAITGRTFGKAVVGLRVVRTSGQPIRPGQALIRVLALPLSWVFFGVGFVGAVFGRQRRTLHDVIARTVEVIDWGDRPAALPGPLSDWLDRRSEHKVSAS